MPATYRVIILPRVLADLQEIFDYIQRQSPQNAATVAQRLIAAIDALEQLPYRYKVHRPHRAPARIVRSMPMPPYIIYYRVDEKNLAVRIMTIRHGSRRQPNRFP
jgi:toxin ParE1/3/4